MHNHDILDFDDVIIENEPFNHFFVNLVLKDGLEIKLLEWLESTDNWDFTETDFYTQYEFSLLNVDIPEELFSLLDPQTINCIKKQFNTNSLELVGLTVHKLIDGYKMGVHNDFIGKDESHRFLIQINSGWTEDNGGYLMLFNSMNSEDVSKIIMPLNNTGFGFEISPKSYHAVSTVYNFSRYTLVYTFKDI
ncbi:2OG-Fe(II) oxygenase [Epilithonimonas sp. JDS]|uniref:cyclophane-containing peptide 2OG-Fe(II) oxygenase YhhC n=1 Tax=Epilithonimonas sp. JDS TaxID=2902797 RepID=UPI001E377F0E|nr:cyclophane-containing peptide 2OG-Fe(II) oxygenase YhhC [Epilithonimonas sp. JDS]MCD9855776.1 2OG-Fe(II) oxygenase [Epilithonimonas sp. JDS]